jgi:hypothetical protein
MVGGKNESQSNNRQMRFQVFLLIFNELCFAGETVPGFQSNNGQIRIGAARQAQKGTYRAYFLP